MKYWPLVWSNLRRRKVRTIFTLLSILVAFVLFAYLGAVRVAFRAGVDVAGADRLYTTHKTSIIQPLPVAYLEQIARVPGVEKVTHATWFGGTYQNPNTGFQGVFQGPVEPESYLDMFPEFQLPEDQRAAWLADREGAIVGRRTAERYGRKVGDRIPLHGTLCRKRDGGSIWEFNLRGIYTGAQKGTDETQFLFHYKYFDEARQFGQGIVGWYLVRIADPARTAEISAAIDSVSWSRATNSQSNSFSNSRLSSISRQWPEATERMRQPARRAIWSLMYECSSERRYRTLRPIGTRVVAMKICWPSGDVPSGGRPEYT